MKLGAMLFLVGLILLVVIITIGANIEKSPEIEKNNFDRKRVWNNKIRKQFRLFRESLWYL